MNRKFFIVILLAFWWAGYGSAVDDPELAPPNVLLIGDSISIGYTEPVKKKLAEHAKVFRIPGNGQYSGFGLENIEKWIADRKWDVIHFNWGLWDICYRRPGTKNPGERRDKVNGMITTTPEQYEENLKQILAILKTSKARLIWCATTPVPEGEPGRIPGDEIKYNAIAERIMKKNYVMINDLHSHALKRIPGIHSAPGDVHYTKEGYEYLAEKVTDSILEALDAQ